MGLIQQEVLELRNLIKEIKGGKVKPEEVNSILTVYGQIHKRTEQLLKIEAMNLKNSKRDGSWKRMDSLNLSGPSDAIMLEEARAVCCNMRGGLVVSREDCLDYSGDSKNITGCQTCEHFETTRKQLLARPT